jgi:hypothetical protein
VVIVSFIIPLIVLYGGISSGTRLPSILIYDCEKDFDKIMFGIMVIIKKKDNNIIKFLFIIIYNIIYK